MEKEEKEEEKEEMKEWSQVEHSLNNELYTFFLLLII